MPQSLTYPGVYINEVPSGVRTVIGVPTSITAFVGTARRGRERPKRIGSWAEYEREFGRLSADSALSYAVYQYYRNGGVDAEIVRVTGAGATAAALDANGLELRAASKGTWANGDLRVRVDYRGVAAGDTATYNLTVRDMTTQSTETWSGLSNAAGAARSPKRVLAASRLVELAGDPAVARPAAHPLPPGGKDPFADIAGAPPPTCSVGSAGADGPAVTAQEYAGSEAAKTGIWSLLDVDIFNLLYLAADDGVELGATLDAALTLCTSERAILLLDPPVSWVSVDAAVDGAVAAEPVGGELAKNAAVYFPRVLVSDPLSPTVDKELSPCGAVAGVIARTDAQRGVWKAPAGRDASLAVNGPAIAMTDSENGRLNPLAVNCIRRFPVAGSVVWGARTLRGADVIASEWKYLPIRRTALYIEETLYRSTQWVVFEPNDEPLWSSIRLNVGAFMNGLWRRGAFQGRTPQQAYLVKCDDQNNPQEEIDQGIVNILVGFAPLKPAEFVVINIQQIDPRAAG